MALAAGIGLLLFVLACLVSGHAAVARRRRAALASWDTHGTVTVGPDGIKHHPPVTSLAIVNKNTMAKEITTTPTRQRRNARRVVLHATMQRRLREQRQQADRAHLATTLALLMEIDRLRKRETFLSHFLEEAAHAAAQGKDPARYLATKAPTTLRDRIAALEAQRPVEERRAVAPAGRLLERAFSAEEEGG